MGGAGSAFQPFQRHHVAPSAQDGSANVNALPRGAPVGSDGSALHALTSTSHAGSSSRPNLLPDLNELPPEAQSPASGVPSSPHLPEGNAPKRGRGRPLGSRDKNPIEAHERRVAAWKNSRAFQDQRLREAKPGELPKTSRGGRPRGSKDRDPEGSHLRRVEAASKRDPRPKGVRYGGRPVGYRDPDEVRQRKSEAMKALYQQRLELTGSRISAETRQRKSDAMQAYHQQRRLESAKKPADGAGPSHHK